MCKVCIVPFTKNEYPLAKTLQKDYAVEALVAPHGIGETGEDIGVLLFREDVGIHITNDAINGIYESDIIIISSVSETDSSLYQYAYNALYRAISFGKKVYSFLSISESGKAEIDVLRKRTSAECVFMNDMKPGTVVQQYENRFHEFPVPVLYVLELFPDCDSYEVFINLSEEFKRRGLRVLSISNDKYNLLLDECYAYLDFDLPMKLSDYPHWVNQAVYNLYKECYPNMIIVRVSIPILEFDEKAPFDLGVSTYAITQSIPGDACVLCIPMRKDYSSFSKWISCTIEERYGLSVAGVHMSNCLIDRTGDSPSATVQVNHQEVEKILSAVDSVSPKAYQLYKEKQVSGFVDSFVDSNIKLDYGVI